MKSTVHIGSHLTGIHQQALRLFILVEERTSDSQAEAADVEDSVLCSLSVCVATDVRHVVD